MYIYIYIRAPPGGVLSLPGDVNRRSSLLTACQSLSEELLSACQLIRQPRNTASNIARNCRSWRQWEWAFLEGIKNGIRLAFEWE